MNTAYCILHKEMVTLTDDGHLVVTETEPGLPELNLCDFPGGLAFAPPPEFNIDEWLIHAEPPTDDELALMDAEAYL